MFPLPLQKLIDKLSSLPDVGPRAAARMALYLVSRPGEELKETASLISNLKNNVNTCPHCFNLTNNKLCSICEDPKRDKSTICVVEDILTISPIEKTKRYNGLYHILGGVISPAEGIGPEKLKIKELVGRLKNSKGTIKEIILALNPTVEGDTTAMYIERELKELDKKEKIGIKITRLGRGISTGTSLEYTDETTLSNAFLGRK